MTAPFIYSGNKGSDKDTVEHVLYELRCELVLNAIKEMRNQMKGLLTKPLKKLMEQTMAEFRVDPKDIPQKIGVWGFLPEKPENKAEATDSDKEENKLFREILSYKFARQYSLLQVLERLQWACVCKDKDSDGNNVTRAEVAKIKKWFPGKSTQLFGGEEPDGEYAPIDWEQFNKLMVAKLLEGEGLRVTDNVTRLRKQFVDDTKAAAGPRSEPEEESAPSVGDWSKYWQPSVLADSKSVAPAGSPAVGEVSVADSKTALPPPPPLDVYFASPRACLGFINNFHVEPNMALSLIKSYFKANPGKSYENDRRAHLPFAAYIWQHADLLEEVVKNDPGMKQWLISLMRHHDFSLLPRIRGGNITETWAEHSSPVWQADRFFFLEPLPPSARRPDVVPSAYDYFAMNDNRRSKQPFDVFLVVGALAILGDRYRLYNMTNNTFFGCAVSWVLIAVLVYTLWRLGAEHLTNAKEDNALAKLKQQAVELTPLQENLLTEAMTAGDRDSSGLSSTSPTSAPLSPISPSATTPHHSSSSLSSSETSTASGVDGASTSSLTSDGLAAAATTAPASKQTWRPFAKVKQWDGAALFSARGLVVGGVGLNLMTQFKTHPAFSPLLGMMIGSAAIVIGLMLEKYKIYQYRMNSPRFDKHTLKDSNRGLLVGALALTGITGLGAAMYCMPNLCAINNTLPFALTLAAALALLVTAVVATGFQWKTKDAPVESPLATLSQAG